MADALVSGTSARKGVRVQLPSSALFPFFKIMLATPSLSDKASFAVTLRWLWPFWRSFFPRLLFLLLATPLVVMFDAYVPMVIKQIVDGLAHANLQPAWLLEKSLLILALGFAHFLLYVLVQSTRGMTNFGFENSFRMHLAQKLVQQGQRFFYAFRTGDVSTRLIDDISENKLGWFACSGIFRLYEALLMIGGCVWFMAHLHSGLTLLTTIPLACVAFFYIHSSRRTQAYSRHSQKAISALNSFLTSALEGIRVVKAYNQEQHQIDAFAEVVEQQMQKEIQLVKVSSLLQLSYSRFSELGALVIFAAGGWLVIHKHMTLGDLIAFNAYIFMLIWPMVDVGQFFIKGRAAGISVERVREMEAFPLDILPNTNALPFPEADFELRLTGVGYDFLKQSGLTNLNLSLHSGETVALVGPVGSGKTLFLNLLPRIIQPQRGSLSLNGRDLAEYDLAALRREIGYVSQSPSLFSNTIAQNICLGRSISHSELLKLVQVAQLEQDLPLFAQGLDTLIGQHGVKLSGGQKQRIAIARALAGKPKILILDDCTSALDAETEASLWQALYAYIPGLLVVLVSHRVSTLQRADKIVLLSEGKILGSGKHFELMEKFELYRQLYLHQPEPAENAENSLL
jgi:ATP-binding cassette, subfamily B, multidrug efflux pump